MIITTKRFLLRDFRDSDRSAFLAYHGDPRSLALYGPDEVTADHARALLRTFELWARARPRRNFQLAVVQRKEAGPLVGCAGLRLAGLGEHRAELGIELAPDYWGRYGFAIEIGRALLAFGFTDLGLREIFGRTISANRRAARLAAWFGATVVVRAPGPAWMQARGWHETEWRITREAWEQRAGVMAR